ncbi:MAG TPA: zinc ABC transporter substrate-binding protein [Pseudogracilibacillus sp.]|nr:zinc ABC transporter substrate-binding protein [Pseudogracilibacillus sp.]
MNKVIKIIFANVFIALFLIGCNTDPASTEEVIDEEKPASEEGALEVITSFTLLEDMATEIGGDYINVYNLVPTGTDPHEYSPLPDDIKAVSNADMLLYNGLNLEGGDDGWFAKIIESTDQDWANAYQVTEGVEPEYIQSDDGREEEINPHSFLDPVVGITMAENTRDAFIKADPDNEDFYQENAEKYIDTLKEMDEQYKTKINEIPEEDRILVTSERAYQYMAKRYGLKEGFIWMIDTEENGTPEQITSLINFIEENEPPVLFVETNVDRRPMETVSSESGVEIFGELYSDEIGEPGEEGDTYLKYLQYNIDVIYEGLTSKE